MQDGLIGFFAAGGIAVLIMFWAIVFFTGMFVAENKGRDSAGTIVGLLFLGPLAFLALVCIPPDYEKLRKKIEEEKLKSKD